MSKHDTEWMEDDQPVTDKVKQSGSGWKFYTKIKESIPDLWSEYYGARRSNGRPEHKTIESFAKKKFKDRKERYYFIWMISPKHVWEEESKSEESKFHVVPWLGDWNKRRKKGFWVTEDRQQIKGLAKAIETNVNSGEAIRATAPFIVQQLMRCVRLSEKIDEMFAGEPFLDGEHPTKKGAFGRYKQYREMQNEVWSDMQARIGTWMRIHGVNPNNPHEMADMANMALAISQGASAAALTGLTAGMHMLPNADGTPSGSHLLTTDNQKLVIGPDALLLAKHLTDHQNMFKKPLPKIEPVTIEGEVKKEKTNGHAKAN